MVVVMKKTTYVEKTLDPLKRVLIFCDDGYTSKKWRNRVNKKIRSLQGKFLFAYLILWERLLT